MRCLVAAMLLLALSLAGCTSPPSQPAEGPLVGDLAPRFTLTTTDNAPWSLEAQRGRVVLLDMMGTNCPPCRQQMPHLLQVATNHSGDPGFAMLSVDMAVKYPGLGARNVDEIEAFRAEFNATWPFAPEAQGVGNRYELISLPTLVLVGPDGRIRAKHTGGVVEAADIEARIAEARGA